MKTRFRELESQYRDALLEDVIPFWEKHSVDAEYGGYYSCLDRAGNVFDTDKFVWLQARQVWMFATLYRRLEQRDTWLDMARHGMSFLKQHGTDEASNWYFSLTREGKPLIQPCNIFSDCFAAMGFGAYALASGDDEARDIAVRTFRNILRRRDNPKGKYSKQFPGTRPLRSLALPMIMINLSLELQDVLDADELDETIDASIEEIPRLRQVPFGGDPPCQHLRRPAVGIAANRDVTDSVRKDGTRPFHRLPHLHLLDVDIHVPVEANP